MKFEEALVHLRAGKKIRNSEWVSEAYISISGEVLIDECGQMFGISLTMILSDKWEIYARYVYIVYEENNKCIGFSSEKLCDIYVKGTNNKIIDVKKVEIYE